jgi:hypothetical protein
MDGNVVVSMVFARVACYLALVKRLAWIDFIAKSVTTMSAKSVSTPFLLFRRSRSISDNKSNVETM